MFPQIFGKYVLEREIAAGGMARVYLATLRGAVGFEKRLVVKQIRPELASDEAFVRRFVEEAKTAVELTHPNIVPVYELGVEQGVYYIAMELCEGATLAEVLAETGPLPAEDGAYVGVEICRALDYAHRRAGIVHRDVTPRNVMIDEEGAVRLIDFGIAAPVAPEAGQRREKKGDVFGSPGHMPPEQLRGERLTAAADVFAVGALLIEAWTGKPPFRRATAEESERALEERPAPIDQERSDLAPLRDLVASAVALDPADRPARAEALARPLRGFVNNADLGDIARRLGERVRRTRGAGESSRSWLVGEGLSHEQGAALAPGSTPSASRSDDNDVVTRTFAARDDIVEWTRKLPSDPPGAPDASEATRQESPGDAEQKGEPARRSDTEASPTTTGARHERSSSGWRAALLLSAVGVAAALLGARWLGRPRAPSEPQRAASSPETQQPRARPRPSSLVHVGPVQHPAPTDPVVRADHRDPARPTGAPPLHSAVSVRQGVVNLTADPPASVSIGGHSYATTPVVGLELPPGAYTVSFKALGVLDERVATQIRLKSGQTRGVHADFTSARARIILR